VRVWFLRVCPGCFSQLLEEEEFKLFGERAKGLGLRASTALFKDILQARVYIKLFGFIPYQRSKGEYGNADMVVYGLCSECLKQARTRREEFAIEVARNIALLVARDSPREVRKMHATVVLELEPR